MNIIGIGGGTGLPVLLRGLREVSEQHWDHGEILPTAVVCVSDNGGSSGPLREAYGGPAVGDLRNCLIALSRGNPALADVFQHRLDDGTGLEGHCLGNLIVTALYARTGSLMSAIHLTAAMLESKGRVLPFTEVDTKLCAEFEDGSVARGETQVVARGRRIRRVWLEPESPPPAPGVLEMIACADAIVLGPGSLYTSIVPNLLAADVADAVRHSPALKIFVCNLMTEPGETDGLTAADHLEALETYLGPGVIHICVLNSAPLKPGPAVGVEQGAVQVQNDPAPIARRGVMPISSSLVAEDGPYVRHDPSRLARLVVTLTRGAMRSRSLLFAEPNEVR